MDAPDFEIDKAARIDAVAGGPVNFDLTLLQLDDEDVRYVAIQVPDYHNGTVAVFSAVGGGLWDFDVFDAAGVPLAGTDFDIGLSSTQGFFSVAAGPQTVYLRVKEQVLNPATAGFTVSAGVTLPAGTVAAPESPSDVVVPKRLDVNQFGKGQQSAIAPFAGWVERYYSRRRGRSSEGDAGRSRGVRAAKSMSMANARGSDAIRRKR